jgi:hypothetical protein
MSFSGGRIYDVKLTEWLELGWRVDDGAKMMLELLGSYGVELQG